MTQLILEGDLLEKLRGLTGKVELLDQGGRLVGVFDPTAEAGAVRLAPPYTEEEIRRGLENPNRTTLSEILARLPES